MTEKYAYSLDEEHYQGIYDTLEEALAEGKQEAEFRNEAGSTVKIWVGKAVPFKIDHLMPDADDIVEMAMERIYDHVGEIGDTYMSDWYPEKRKYAADAINAELPAIIVNLFKLHGVDLIPSCYGIDDTLVHDYEIPGGKDEK